MDALKEKYYKPDISEFHVGFEFEMLSSYGFISVTYPEIKETHFLRKKGDTLNKLKSILSSTRVKYLDQEDIESLGFIYTKTDKYNPYGVKHIYLKTTSYGEIEIRHYPDTYHIGIDDGNTLFSGKIKNKSELKRILNMIGYEC